MTAVVRQIAVDPPEGATSDHTPYEYQLGAEIEGVWVPFVTKAGGYIDSLVSSGQASQPEQTTTTATTPETTAEPEQTTGQ